VEQVRGRWLWLGSLALGSLMLGGCGSGRTTASPSPSPTGTAWVVTITGSATPSPTPSRAIGTPSAWPTGFLPLPSGGATTPTPTGSDDCPGGSGHEIAGATVVPSSTSAAVTFYNPGGQYLVEYRITAISQDLVTGEQRDVGWTVLTPGSGCGYLTATVTGLDPKTNYMFSVDAVSTKIGVDGTQAVTIARSRVVRTT
jgi:hypothetical protein